jgi:hypothetical protein
MQHMQELAMMLQSNNSSKAGQTPITQHSSSSSIPWQQQ